MRNIGDGELAQAWIGLMERGSVLVGVDCMGWIDWIATSLRWALGVWIGVGVGGVGSRCMGRGQIGVGRAPRRLDWD